MTGGAADEPQSCLDRLALESIASGGDISDAMAAHLSCCDLCQSMLERIRRDNALLSELAHAVEAPAQAEAVPGYDLIGEIHRGAQGAVHRAVHRATRRTVAVKILHRGAFASFRQRQRFEREVELLAALRHPNVVTVYDSGRTGDGGFFLAMEHVEGRPLDRVLGDVAHRPPRDRAALVRTLESFAALCAGVGAAHRRGIIHRDLKPQNILIDSAGEPRVIDFGLARTEVTGEVEDDAARAARTMEGEFVGTLAYAAPEQVEGDPRLLDTRADVYALGVILYQLVTGRRPYALPASLAAIVDTIRHVEPPPPSRFNPAVDEALDAIILRALRKDPDARYGSANALDRDVRRWITGDAVEAMQGRRAYLLRVLLRRYRAAVAVAGAFVILLAIFGVTMTILYAKTKAANDSRRDALAAMLGVVQSEQLHQRMDEQTLGRLLAQIETSLRVNLMDRGPDAWIHFRELGLNQLKYGQFDAAERQFNTALRMLEEIRKEPDADIANLLHQRGRALWFQGQYEAARGAYRRALDMRLALQGPVSPDVAETTSHLGATYEALGDLDEAERLKRRALSMRLELHGPESLEYARSLNSLGVLLRARGKHEEALATFQSALDLAIRNDVGPEGRGTALQNVGRAQMDLGRLDDAERSLLEALATKRQIFEDHHRSVLVTEVELARLRLRQDRLDEAETTLERILPYQEQMLGEQHPETVESRELQRRVKEAQSTRAGS